VRSVAMESTSVYWIFVYQILESRGIEVCFVNAQQVKNVPGRKTDESDCQWLQYLHSEGLLRASLRPPGFICAIRSLWRHMMGPVGSSSSGTPFAVPLTMLKMRQEDEFDADYFGVQYLFKAGYDAKCFSSFVQRI
jgi:hypothetical protein